MTEPTSEGNAVIRAFDLQVDEKNRVKDVNEKGKVKLTVEAGQQYPHDIAVKIGKLTKEFKDDLTKTNYAKKMKELKLYKASKEKQQADEDRGIDD